jgi:hypothetical protein
MDRMNTEQFAAHLIEGIGAAFIASRAVVVRRSFFLGSERTKKVKQQAMLIERV